MEGADLNTVRELLGHKSIKMTLRYAHLSPNHKKQAINLIDRAFGVRPHEELRFLQWTEADAGGGELAKVSAMVAQAVPAAEIH